MYDDLYMSKDQGNFGFSVHDPINEDIYIYT